MPSGIASPEDAFAYGLGIPKDATWRNLLPVAEFGLGMAPGSGEAMSARDAWDASGRAAGALERGEYGNAMSEYMATLLASLGAVPGLGVVARGTKRGAAWMDQNLPEGFNRLLDAVYPSDPASTTNIFAGPTAKTADHAALAQAQEMKAQGASRADIWRETGWDLEKADKIPRFEIDDSGSFYRGTSPASSSDAEKAFQHPEFYSAYPEAGNVKITEIPRPDMSEPMGSYSQFYNEIELGGRDKSSTALHEMQHYVQDLEGLAPGGNPGQFANIWGPQANRVRIPMETKLVAEELGIQGIPWPGDPDYDRLKEAVRKSIEDRSGSPFTFRHVSEGMDDFDWHYGTTMQAPREQIAQETNLGLRNLGMDQYRRTAGEVEARNVQTRIPMTAAERRATPPWETQDVPDDHQIVRFGNQGPAYSLNSKPLSLKLTSQTQVDKGFVGGVESAFDIMDGGTSVGKIYGGLTDPHTFKIDWMQGTGGESANSMGPTAIRSLIQGIKEQFPEVRQIVGERGMGARKGTEKAYETVRIPVR